MVLIRRLTDRVTKFGRDEAMIDFCKEYNEMFNDAEFNLYESSNNKDSEEGGSDGNKEKMTEEDREVTVQIDVDNQNEELNKEKDANETEDNDKVNNNEMNNDSLQDKQDADKDENAEKEKVKTEKKKQDKADKVDHVQEKQDDDKNEIDDDEFWNT
nr:hypothetical protein [Tanacetum cinerariifolium]